MPKKSNHANKLWHISKSFVDTEDAAEFIKEKELAKGTSNKDKNSEFSQVYYTCRKKCRCSRNYKMVYPKSSSGCYLASEGELKIPGCWENDFAEHKMNSNKFLEELNSKLPPPAVDFFTNDDNIGQRRDNPAVSTSLLPEQSAMMDEVYDSKILCLKLENTSIEVSADHLFSGCQMYKYMPDQTKVPPPTYKQCQNWIYLKKSRALVDHFGECYDSKNITTNDIREFCDKHNGSELMETNEEHLDTPFVLKYFIDDSETKVRWSFIMATKRLLLAVPSPEDLCINSDATYNLVWGNFPVINMGFTDRNRHYTMCLISVSSDEKFDQYRFCFEAWNNYYKEIKGVGMDPRYVMCDGAEQIVNGAHAVWPLCKRLMCFIHVQRNMDKKAQSIPNPEIRSLLHEDICALAIAHSDDLFVVAVNLFKIKWADIATNWDKNKTDTTSLEFVVGYSHRTCVEDVLDHFYNEYIYKRSNWYRGAAPGFILNNNGQEGKHKWIKAKGTFRKNMTLDKFSLSMFAFMRFESKRINPNNKGDRPKFRPIVNEPTNNYGDDGRAWQVAKNDDNAIFHKIGNDFYVTNAGSGSVNSKTNSNNSSHRIKSTFTEEVATAMVNQYHINMDYQSFDKYKQFQQEIHIIFRSTAAFGVLKFECTCRYYAKYLKCCHQRGTALRIKALKEEDLDYRAKNNEVGVKLGRGAPKKFTPVYANAPKYTDYSKFKKPIEKVNMHIKELATVSSPSRGNTKQVTEVPINTVITNNSNSNCKRMKITFNSNDVYGNIEMTRADADLQNQIANSRSIINDCYYKNHSSINEEGEGENEEEEEEQEEEEEDEEIDDLDFNQAFE